MSNRFSLFFVGPLLAACLFIFACHTPKPKPPAEPQYHVKVTPKPLLAGASSFACNIYTIQGYAAGPTNRDNVEIQAYWPSKRVHIDLSLNGGTNYSRRIGYGVPVDPDRINVTYEYSLPWWDPTLMTECAKLRITDLAGTEIATSFPFVIAGLWMTAPAQADVLIPGTIIDLTWLQYGAGSEVEMGYITPSNETWAPFITFSNCVAGSNTRQWNVTLPLGISQAKFVLRSVSKPALIGYSGVFSTP